MKNFSKLIAFMLCFTLVFGLSGVVQAAETEYSEIPTSGRPSADLTFGKNPSLLRYATGIAVYGDSISCSGTTVYLEGETVATDTASQVGNSIIALEVWDGYGWSRAWSGSKFNYNSRSCIADYTFTGTSGTYYRVYGTHMAIINGTTYSYSCTSDYIYVR